MVKENVGLIAHIYTDFLQSHQREKEVYEHSQPLGTDQLFHEFCSEHSWPGCDLGHEDSFTDTHRHILSIVKDQLKINNNLSNKFS